MGFDFEVLVCSILTEDFGHLLLTLSQEEVIRALEYGGNFDTFIRELIVHTSVYDYPYAINPIRPILALLAFYAAVDSNMMRKRQSLVMMREMVKFAANEAK